MDLMQIVAVVVFVVAMVAIMSEKVHRALVATSTSTRSASFWA